MANDKWNKFMTATSKGALDTEIARRVGVSPSTISRWRSGATDPKPRQVVQFARAFEANPLAALVAAEYLNEEDLAGAANVHVSQGAEGLSLMELVDEVRERAENTGIIIEWIKAISEGRDSGVTASTLAVAAADPNRSPVDALAAGFPQQVSQALRPYLRETGKFEDQDVYTLTASEKMAPVAFPPFGERLSFEELDKHRSVAKKKATEQELDPDAD